MVFLHGVPKHVLGPCVLVPKRVLGLHLPVPKRVLGLHLPDWFGIGTYDGYATYSTSFVASRLGTTNLGLNITISSTRTDPRIH